MRQRGDGEEAHVPFQQFRRPMARIEAKVEEPVGLIGPIGLATALRSADSLRSNGFLLPRVT